MKEFTEAEVAMMSDRELIVEYLRRYAEENPEFKANLEDGKHTIDGCMAHVRKCAMESITFDGNMAMAWHTRVFGWALAYYMKPVETPAKKQEAKPVDKAKTKPAKKQEKKPAADVISKKGEESSTEEKKSSEKAQEKPEKATPVIKMQPKVEKKPAKKQTKVINDIYQLDLSLFD